MPLFDSLDVQKLLVPTEVEQNLLKSALSRSSCAVRLHAQEGGESHETLGERAIADRYSNVSREQLKLIPPKVLVDRVLAGIRKALSGALSRLAR